MRTFQDEKHSIKGLVPWVVLILVLAPFIFLSCAFWRDRSLSTGFNKITDGATQQEVVRLMGKPKKVEKCGEFFGPIPESEINICASEYLYAATFAPYTPEYFIVRFDGRGHVISKVPLSSP
jgi:hypothetical protein